ncbi:DNA polymerase III delta prime subunit (plasmid) [Gloeothece citriformis PCC 7424]|uniref:DNA polymerase III delta prime subunit n=1 Tax=Gloeothece citriformis (strain PCC 7424) TaxID=65393 RepID=B7KMR1_GLOC7|nr:AAA family ATPase [Gloeothece citriformis]ACK74083.1 DNA polymerase III delta prime subunit [Gloeothece citriformis PCC 7424]
MTIKNLILPITSLDLLNQIKGQKVAHTLFRHLFLSPYIPLAPAYLFTGIEGIGKITFAKLLAQCILNTDNITNYPNILWIEPTYLQQGELISLSIAKRENLEFKIAPIIRIEQVKQIIQFISNSPISNERLLVIIEKADCLNPIAANALLKSLEEPGKATFILTSSNPEKLLATVISRCQIVPFFPLNDSNIREILNKCGYADISNEVIELAQGSPGKAIIYHQLIDSIPDELLNCPKIGKVSNALQLAKEMTKYSLEQQLLLADYWQYKQSDNREVVQLMETLKSQLFKANHHLVWEVNLIRLTQ